MFTLTIRATRTVLTAFAIAGLLPMSAAAQEWVQPERSKANLDALARVQVKTYKFEAAANIEMQYRLYVPTKYDAARCGTRVHTHWVGGFQKVLEETLNEPDRERRKMLLYGDFMTRTLWAITYSSTNIAQCFECMRVCPAAHGLREMK